MNYNELKKLAQSKEITIKRLAERMELSENGLKRSIENETMGFGKVKELCFILGISISEFFGESKSGYNQQNFKSIVGEGANYYDNTSAMRIIEKQLAEKDLYIKELLSIIKSNNH